MNKHSGTLQKKQSTAVYFSGIKKTHVARAACVSVSGSLVFRNYAKF